MINEWRSCDPWWWSPPSLGEEITQRCAVEFGERTVFGNHVGHTFTLDLK